MTRFLRTCIINFMELNIKNTYQSRYYARWSHRRPRKVLSSEDYEEYNVKNSIHKDVIELDPKTDAIQEDKENMQSKWVPGTLMPDIEEIKKQFDVKKAKISKRKNKQYKNVKDATKTTVDMLETVIDADGNLNYTKLPNKDPVIGHLMITVKSTDERKKKELALLEGKRLIKDALKSNCILKYLIFSRKNDIESLKPYLPKSGAKLYKIPYREIELWSDLSTTPGIMGIFKIPNAKSYLPKTSLPLTIICDNIREPGNLGSILRIAAGVGAKNILLSKGCVNLWDTKVLRSACGAHFCLQIHDKMEWSNIEEYIDSSNSVFIADNRVITESEDVISNENNLQDLIVNMPLIPYYGIQYANLNSITLIIGGETHGISEESYRIASHYNGIRLNIPLSNNIESLNTGTALAIILFEIKKQMIANEIDDDVVSVNYT